MTSNNPRKILVIQEIHPEGMRRLEARDDVTFEVLTDTSEEILRQRIADVHGVTVRATALPRSVLEAAERLEVVSRHGVGYDAVDVPTLTERGIPLTIAVGSNAISVAEQALALILALAKRIRAYDRATREERFHIRTDRKAFDLNGRTLLVVGFGRIGSRVGPLARAFGMEVLAYDPYVDPGRIREAGCEPCPALSTALARSDVVTVHCPLNDETRGLIGAAELAALPASALVINCARGGIVDEAALHAALVAGDVAGAGLDVFATEPPPPDDPLLALDNVVLSPHVAGLSEEACVRMAEITVENVLAAFDGRLDPAVVVNPEVLES